MGNTNADGIWTPDEDDTMEAEVWSAAMADSISQGLGKRMKLQETRISLRATTPVPFDLISTANDGNAYMEVPLTVGGWTGSRDPEPDFAPGNHANGIEMEGNRAKIVTPGLYTIQGVITLYRGPGMEDESWDFLGKINNGVFGLPDYGATNGISFVSGRVADTRYLAKGDTIGLTIGLGTDHIGGLHIQDALLTISMAYATPDV